MKKGYAFRIRSRRTLPFLYLIIISVLNLLYHSRTVLEADLVGSSHLSSGSIAHAVEELVKYVNLLLTQRILKGYAELALLIRELGGVNITLAVVVNHIDHRYISFQIQHYRKKTALKSSLIGVY